MKELEYPFDIEWILKKKKKIRNQLLVNSADFLQKRIAILGGSTTHSIKEILELFLLNSGIQPEFYESEYNQYYEDAVFQNAALSEFQPDVIYVCTTNRNISCYPKLEQTSNEIEHMLNHEFQRFQTIWKNCAERYYCPIIQNNFEMHFYRLLGNKDTSDIHGAINYISRLNLKFYEYAQTHNDFYICDINYISSDYGLKKWSDPFYWYMYKYAVNPNAVPNLAYNLANMIKSIFGKNKKAIVLDLDNTLCGDVIGDVGAENIILGNETAEGEAYTEFQNYMKSYRQLGIVLNIASKNEKENALGGLSHPDSKLQPNDFAVIEANWNPKDQSIHSIANTLNLTLDSFVFVDDNPAERDLVRKQIPCIAVPELSDIHHYIQEIDHSGFFEITNVSEDDFKRNDMYAENQKRESFHATYKDYTEYLLALEMQAEIRSFEPIYLARITQLTNKSNQFNLTTKRYSQKEIEKISKNGDYITLYGRLKDRFGDNGIVSVIIGLIKDGICHIDLWLMSCRVLKRDMEYAMFDRLIEICQKQKLKGIFGYYYPTAKNFMVKDFYGLLGFEKLETDHNNNSKWYFELSNEYIKRNKVIKIKEG